MTADIAAFLAKGSHTKYSIAISGAADTSHCPPEAFERTTELGRLVAERGMILLTGATSGAPFWAAKAAKEAGGLVIGFSPAVSQDHHVKTYRLPLDYHDLIIYTGFNYSGRNLILTRAADAVVTVCGRIGTLNEFTIAFEEKVPQGVLTGTGGVSDILENILDVAHRGHKQVVFNPDPATLLDSLQQMIAESRLHAETVAAHDSRATHERT